MLYMSWQERMVFRNNVYSISCSFVMCFFAIYYFVLCSNEGKENMSKVIGWSYHFRMLIYFLSCSKQSEGGYGKNYIGGGFLREMTVSVTNIMFLDKLSQP